MRPLVFGGLLLSGALILVAGYPWGDHVGHAHWTRVGWVPFLSGPIRPSDLAGNLLLGVPFGIFAGLGLERSPLIAGAATLILAVFVEAVQVYSHSRFPSATDVVCIVTGAVAAAALVRVYLRHAPERPS